MSTQTRKLLSILSSGLIALLLVAAQCEAQSARSVAGQPNGAEHSEHNEAGPLAPVTLDSGEKLRVVATTNIVAELVRNVGHDLVELTTLIPLGSDPHTFAATPQDVALVADAHVVFLNGLHLEEFMGELIENAGGEATVVALATGIEPREFGVDEDKEDGEHYHPTGVDPHIWMSPANAMVMVQTVAQTLSELDPAHAAAYQANAQSYVAQLEALDEWVGQQIQRIPPENRKLVIDHDTFGYYADRYGLELIGAVVPNYSTNAEPSAQEMAELQKAINEHGVKSMFVGTTVNPVLARRIAEDTGIQLVPLYTGSLGDAGSGAETYIDYIRYNTTAIVEGLK